MAFTFTEGIPYYYQVREHLRERILKGEFEIGERLPGEHELAQAYGVSRPTIRQAIQGLVETGHVTKVKGKGTFVHGPLVVDDAQVFTVFSDMTIEGLGRSRLLSWGGSRASAEVAEALGLRTGTELFEVRVRYVSRGEPIALRTFALPLPGLPGIAEPGRDMTPAQLMAELGLHDVQAIQTFQAKGCPAADAKLLRLPVGAPVIVWQGVLYQAGRRAAHVRTVFRGDRVSFLIRQGRDFPL